MHEPLVNTALYFFIDGHHKLVQWRFVTHCGIDGYSRLVVYLKCSNNNTASTVYNLFLEAVDLYGLPSRVRSDQGTENYRVAQHMLEHRGIERRSMLVGTSVHNQRIERFWRDLHRCVTGTYYRLFYFLEQQGVLDPLNEYHLYALHFIYLPRINRSLEEFKAGWNHHSIRTEHNATPLQLFSAGALRLRNSGAVAVDFFDRVENNYGVEEDGVVGNDGGVDIPENRIQLSGEQHSELQSRIDPLSDGDDFGVELYERTLDFLRTIVTSRS